MELFASTPEDTAMDVAADAPESTDTAGTPAARLRYKTFARRINLTIDVELAEAQNFVDKLSAEYGENYKEMYVQRTEDKKIQITGVMENGLIVRIDYGEFCRDRFHGQCMALFS